MISVSSFSIVLPSIQTKYPIKFSKRSSSSKTSQRKSIPKDEEYISSNDAKSVSIFSSAKIRYCEDADNEEDNDDIGNFGLEIQSSSNQLRYKYLGK